MFEVVDCDDVPDAGNVDAAWAFSTRTPPPVLAVPISTVALLTCCRNPLRSEDDEPADQAMALQESSPKQRMIDFAEDFMIIVTSFLVQYFIFNGNSIMFVQLYLVEYSPLSPSVHTILFDYIIIVIIPPKTAEWTFFFFFFKLRALIESFIRA